VTLLNIEIDMKYQAKKQRLNYFVIFIVQTILTTSLTPVCTGLVLD